jgi:signal transduction histidine kinase
MTAVTRNPDTPSTPIEPPQDASVLNPAQRVARRSLVLQGSALALIAIVVGGAGLLWMLYLALSWYNLPFTGYFASYTHVITATRSLSGTDWAGYIAGLKALDRITRIKTPAGEVKIDLADRDSHTKVLALLGESRRGQELVVDILRPPGQKVDVKACTVVTSDGSECSFTYFLGQMPFFDFVSFFVLPFGVALVFYGVGVWSFVTRRKVTPARIFGAASICVGLVITGFFDQSTTHSATLLWTLAACMVGGASLELGMVFPYEIGLVRRVPALRFSPILLGFLAFTGCYFLFSQPDVSSYDSQQVVAVLVAGAGGLALIGLLNFRRVRSPSPIAREQAGVVLVALILAFVPVGLWLLTTLADRVLNLGWLRFSGAYLYPSLLLIPISFVYAFSQRSLIDLDRMERGFTLYGMLGAALVIGYTLITFSLYLLTWGLLRWDNPILVAVTIFSIAFAFVPIRVRLENLLDNTFFKQRRLYETRVETFARRMTSVVTTTEAAKEFYNVLAETIKPEYAFVFQRNPITGDFEALPNPTSGRTETDVRFSPGSPLLTHLATSEEVLYITREQPLPPALATERSRLSILNTPVLVAFNASDRLNGFAAIGPRQGRQSYNFEELKFIEGLSDQAALAFERAQVVIEAQRNEKELRVLSQVSSALNITMDFDTLLEFIHTQIDKVSPASYFYIALTTSEKELYFAFYLEDDNRDPSMEGMRWSRGKDLFSEVIRMQQPIRIDNYLTEVTKRELLNPIRGTPLRSWLAVPLNVGMGTPLGVVAIGSVDQTVTFTDEQQSIIGSIADLAATALDKARLFRETEERARQLSVLNEISTQLASEFEHVESLLDIITRSAVEILRAEAGSLLLTDESTSDLVFEVVIGGAGETLLGTRIPPGTGIVGKVASTGRYVISNQARSNPDWFGEVSENRATTPQSFKTSSILAVPLMVKNRVIGVLEVINKRDSSSVFVEADANLLTTFASQAAIAIENAKLFRMTDQQLSVRVKQLDNMARIDQELNRTLDLRSVIDLTLDNALRESGADAGSLALVRTEPIGFEVVGSLGYPNKTFTPGEVYPIDMGVMGRVYRTGQSSLVTELEADPDYVETLPNAVGQLAVPMITAGKGVTAVLLLETRQYGMFNMMNMNFITALAEHANTAITNAQLFQQLQQANSARTTFVGFVAHELKNPMASIKGYSEVLLGGMAGQLSDQQKNFINTISRNAIRMQQIVDDLRDLTAIETGKLAVKLRPTSIHHVALETLRPLQRSIDEKGQHVLLQISEDLPDVQGDEGRLIQVMTNFVSNAHKYSPENTEILLRAEVTDNKWDSSGAPFVIHCEIKDQGIGMDEDDLKKLSTPYFRSQNPNAQAQPGTGLGMTITYALIEQHGGTIWVESEIGKGTSFHFTVPLADQKQPAVS